MDASRPSLMAFLQLRTAMGACAAIPAAIFSAAGSSSSTTENSSSSEAEVNSSSSEEHTTFVQAYAVNPLKVSIAGRMLQITGADVVQVEVFDMQGSPVASFRQVAGSVSLEKLRQGNYIVRVRSGSMSLTRRVSIK
jgi:flagella basal body P-ring formation protein FlgA